MITILHGINMATQTLLDRTEVDSSESTSKSAPLPSKTKKIKLESNHDIFDVVGNRYIFKKLLGHGTFGKVSLIQDTLTNKTYVRKETIGKVTKVDRNENRILMDIDKFNKRGKYLTIVPNINIKKSIIFKYIGGKDLTTIKIPSLKKQLWIMRESLQQLMGLHGKRIYHRDIKPNNIIVSPKSVQIIDYGLAIYSHEIVADKMSGTVLYWSPLLVKTRPITSSTLRKNDIWALGKTFLETFYPDINKMAYHKSISTKNIIKLKHHGIIEGREFEVLNDEIGNLNDDAVAMIILNMLSYKSSHSILKKIDKLYLQMSTSNKPSRYKSDELSKRITIKEYPL